jgi:tetratricopeptide (TPR) repeat protein
MARDCANAAVVFRALMACVSACALASGCQSFSRRGPVSQEVQTCRQLSSQGMAAMDRGDWTKAEDLLNASVKSCPIDPEARRRYAEVLWHRGDAAGAMGQLEEAARLSTDNPAITIRMGEIYLALNHPANALAAADRALRVDPQNPVAWTLRARAAQAAGDPRQALANYQRALGYQPHDPRVLEQLAELYRTMGQPERALTALQTLLDTYSPGEEPSRALHLQGLALAALGRHDAAVNSFQLAADRGGASADLFCHLAEAQISVHRFDEARQTTEKALAIAPNHPASRALAARLQIAEKDGPNVVRR